jgi:hypothetical protein
MSHCSKCTLLSRQCSVQMVICPNHKRGDPRAAQMEPLIVSRRMILRNPSSKQQALENSYQMGVSALPEVPSLIGHSEIDCS